MTKPFWPGERLARVRARLRRPMLQRQGLVEAASLLANICPPDVRVLGKPVECTRVEFDLLAALARRLASRVTGLHGWSLKPGRSEYGDSRWTSPGEASAPGQKDT